MRRILTLFIILALTMTFTNAEEFIVDQISPEQQEINLDVGCKKKTYNLEKNKYNKNIKVNSVSEKTPEVQDYSQTNPNQKRSATTNRKKKIKDVTVGSKTTHTMTSDTYSGANTMYAEYEKEKFKLNSGYTRNTTPNQENMDKGTVSVTPEYKLNKHVSVQNQYSTNMNDNSKKTEVRLNVQPLNDDRMNMGVGVGQKFSGSSAPSSSQVNFSTNLKF